MAEGLFWLDFLRDGGETSVGVWLLPPRDERVGVEPKDTDRRPAGRELPAAAPPKAGDAARAAGVAEFGGRRFEGGPRCKARGEGASSSSSLGAGPPAGADETAFCSSRNVAFNSSTFSGREARLEWLAMVRAMSKLAALLRHAAASNATSYLSSPQALWMILRRLRSLFLAAALEAAGLPCAPRSKALKSPASSSSSCPSCPSRSRSASASASARAKAALSSSSWSRVWSPSLAAWAPRVWWVRAAAESSSTCGSERKPVVTGTERSSALRTGLAETEGPKAPLWRKTALSLCPATHTGQKAPRPLRSWEASKRGTHEAPKLAVSPHRRPSESITHGMQCGAAKPTHESKAGVEKLLLLKSGRSPEASSRLEGMSKTW
mmetsp:Transcript_50306/g.114190  ORF Transcript_50306/g.114190 Transcript_50306/m.114190 type:complete len:379 (+) Transcript_50306:241-1377(+)